MKTANILHIFRSRSVFFRFFILLSALVILMTSLFSILLYRVVRHNYKKMSEESVYSALCQRILRVDDSIMFLDQQLNMLTSRENIINAVVVPGLKSSERNASVATVLQDIVRDNKYIEGALLYEDTQQIIFASNGTAYSYRESLFSGIVEDILNDEEAFLLYKEDNRVRTCLHILDGQLYISRGFIYSAQKDTPLATLIFRVSLPQLFSFSTDLWEGDSTLQVFSWKNHPIYSSISPEKDNTESLTVSAYSEYSGMHFQLSAVPPSIFSLQDVMQTFVTFLPICLIVGFSLALIITKNLYRPIKELVLYISDKNRAFQSPLSNKKMSYNETDFLQASFDHILGDKEKFQFVLKNIQSDLEIKLFTNLLNNSSSTEDALYHTLEQIESPFLPDGNYQLFLSNPIWHDQSDELTLYYFQKTMESIMPQVFKSTWGTYIFMVYKESPLLIVKYSQQYSLAQIKGLETAFLEQSRNANSESMCQALIASSPLFHHIHQISHAYCKVCNTLQYMSYYISDQNNIDAKDFVMRREYSMELQKVSRLLSQGDIETLNTYLNQITEQLYTDCIDTESLFEWYERISTILTLKIVDYHADPASVRAKIAECLHGALKQDQPRQALFQGMKNLIQFCKKELCKQAYTRQERLVSNAKDYIENSFHDGNLSIDQIAESVGVSSAYLSSIFNQYAGENLVSYLNSYRVQMAKELLTNTSIAIKDVGYQVGFNSVQNFNRVFKRYANVTPSQYRSHALERKTTPSPS